MDWELFWQAVEDREDEPKVTYYFESVAGPDEQD